MAVFASVNSLSDSEAASEAAQPAPKAASAKKAGKAKAKPSLKVMQKPSAAESVAASVGDSQPSELAEPATTTPKRKSALKPKPAQTKPANGDEDTPRWRKPMRRRRERRLKFKFIVTVLFSMLSVTLVG